MKSFRKQLLTLRTGCCTAMETRSRFSKKSLALAFVIVAGVTFTILLAEGVVTFTRKPVDVLPTGDSPPSHKRTVNALSNGSADGSEKTLSSSANAVMADDSVCRPGAAGDGDIVSASECRRCDDHELGASGVLECNTTGYVELTVKCRDGRASQRKYRPCGRDHSAETRKFLWFEAGAFGLGVASFAVVVLRRRKLDYSLAKKIEQQLASGV